MDRALGLVQACALGLAFVVSTEVASGAERGPIVVQVLAGAQDLDESALRDAVSSELGVRALAPNDADADHATSTLTVGIEREHRALVVTRRGVSGTIVRRVALPETNDEAKRAAVFLIGNLARDEASEILGEMSAPDAAPAAVPAANGSALPPSSPPPAPLPAPPPTRFWFGLAIEGGLTVLPSSHDTCKLSAAGALTSGYSCTTGGGDFPPLGGDGSQNASIALGRSDQVASGLAFTNVRYLATAAYAVTDNVLVGARVGYASATYPGSRVSAFGHLHVEARASYVLGERPLAESGIAPAFVVGAGAAEVSANVPVTLIGASGQTLPATAWRVGGPLFASVGAGARFAASPSFAITAYPAKVTLAFGSSSIVAFSPEVAAEIGF